jgi:dihydropteroate synthase
MHWVRGFAENATSERAWSPAVMAILNITPDSFSDGGVHFDHPRAVHGALQMIEDGADLIDIGGESTRPGAEEVSLDVELERVVPVVEALRKRSDIPISIDTRKARVAEAALDAGASLINDVSALRHDPGMRALAARRGVPVILMHMRGEPGSMQQHAHYDDVVADVKRELQSWREAAIEAGVDPAQILVDPGIGFAKTFDHNLELLARCDEMRDLGPVVVGASRKKFIGHITGREATADRLAGSLAAIDAAYRGGAAIVRVHDVKETVDFLRVLRAIDQKAGNGRGGRP